MPGGRLVVRLGGELRPEGLGRPPGALGERDDAAAAHLGGCRPRLPGRPRRLPFRQAERDPEHPTLDDEQVRADLTDPPLLVGARSELRVARPLDPPEEAGALLLEAVGQEADGLPDEVRPVRGFVHDDERNAVMMRVYTRSWRMRSESGPPRWVTPGGMSRVPALSKSETFNRIAEKTGLKRQQVREVFDELASIAYKEAKNGFTIPGVGKLVIVDRKARLGRNPATGEQIQIPAKRVLKFRIAKQAKDATLPSKPAAKKK